jgi:hypothetical protein
MVLLPVANTDGSADTLKKLNLKKGETAAVGVVVTARVG